MSRLRIEHKYLLVVLIVGFLNGLIYVFLTPPWQHYDEPNHFEYTWLIAHRKQLPQLGDNDQEMRRETVISMIEHDFFRGTNFLPDLEAKDQPIWFGGYSQLADPPLYYILGTMPLLLPIEDITTQLYSVRLVSLLLYLVSIFAAWGIMVEITSRGNPLRLLVPLTMALLPGFAEVMTAVNNIVGATAFFCLCLWGCVRLVVKGFSVINFLWAAIAALMCWFTSVTAYFAIPIFFLSLALSFFQGKWRVLAWGLVFTSILAGLLLIINRGDPAYWYRATHQEVPIRQKDSRAIVGNYVFQVDVQGEVSPAWLVPVFQSIGDDLSPGTYTFGSWMWASQAIRVQTPTVGVSSKLTFDQVELGATPTFYAFPVTIEKKGSRTWISLAPKAGPIQQGIVYYDGLVLAKGEHPLNQEPAFDDPDGKSGLWGGISFKNLLRNASAEKPGLRLNPVLDRIGARMLPDNTMPSLLLTYILDWEGAGWHYRDVGRILLRSFWGAFGWAHVPLVWDKSYQLLTIGTTLAILGCMINLARRIARGKGSATHSSFWDIILLFGIVLALIWGSTLLRGAIYLASAQIYIPVARYAYPAIVPTVLILAAGWITILSSLFTMFKGWISRPQYPIMWIYISGLLIFDVFALWSIYRYYSG